MNTCIATITVGSPSQDMWSDIFAPSWRAYADRHNYTIEQFKWPMDHETTKHPSWQKLLLAGEPRLAKYDQIVYLDHDILINDKAPRVTVPVGMIGAVNWRDSLGFDPVVYEAHRQSWRRNNEKWVRDAKLESFGDLLKLAGYPPTEDHMNAGVLVFDKSHANLLRGLYQTEAESQCTSLEQSALTNCLCNTHKELLYPIDRRFNQIWYLAWCTYYPFLSELYPGSVVLSRCVEAVLNANFFLHFAGDGDRSVARHFVAALKIEAEGRKLCPSA